MEWFEPACLIIEVSQIVVHKACQPDMVFDLFDADGLTGEDQTEIDLLAPVTDASACCDGDCLVVERVVEIG